MKRNKYAEHPQSIVEQSQLEKDLGKCTCAFLFGAIVTFGALVQMGVL